MFIHNSWHCFRNFPCDLQSCKFLIASLFWSQSIVINWPDFEWCYRRHLQLNYVDSHFYVQIIFNLLLHPQNGRWGQCLNKLCNFHQLFNFPGWRGGPSVIICTHLDYTQAIWAWNLRLQQKSQCMQRVSYKHFPIKADKKFSLATAPAENEANPVWTFWRWFGAFQHGECRDYRVWIILESGSSDYRSRNNLHFDLNSVRCLPKNRKSLKTIRDRQKHCPLVF